MAPKKDLFEPMNHPLDDARPMHFIGAGYDKKHDQARLTGQIKRVYDLMSDGLWYTLDDISRSTQDPQASISAQIRNLRKECYGGHTVNRRRRGDPENGLHEYQLIIKKAVQV